MLLNWWFYGLTFINVVYNPVLTANTTIKFVSVIGRHSDRAPEPSSELYKNDPYKNYNFDPPGFGKVSISGKARAINLGKFLRTTYKDLLAPTYISGSIEARSTDIARTKESLNFILTGLYPGAVVPTKFDPTLKDVLLYPQLCPEYVSDYVAARKNAKEEIAKLQGSIDKLCSLTGYNMNQPLALYQLYTTLECEKFLNLTLPDWTKIYYPNGDLLKGIILEYNIMNDNDKMKRENGGRLINKIQEDMVSVRSGKMDKNRKLMLYVAYDLNVVAILKALNVFYPHTPQFSSAVFIELHLIGEDYYVQVNYYLGIPEKMNILTIPGCETLCPLEQFSTLMKNVIPSSLELACDNDRSLGGVITLPPEPDAIMTIFKNMFSE